MSWVRPPPLFRLDLREEFFICSSLHQSEWQKMEHSKKRQIDDPRSIIARLCTPDTSKRRLESSSFGLPGIDKFSPDNGLRDVPHEVAGRGLEREHGGPAPSLWPAVKALCSGHWSGPIALPCSRRRRLSGGAGSLPSNGSARADCDGGGFAGGEFGRPSMWARSASGTWGTFNPTASLPLSCYD